MQMQWKVLIFHHNKNYVLYGNKVLFMQWKKPNTFSIAAVDTRSVFEANMIIPLKICIQHSAGVIANGCSWLVTLLLFLLQNVLLFFVSQISWLIKMLCATSRPRLELCMCQNHIYVLLSFQPFFSHPLKVPAVFRCFSLRRPDAELHGVAEKAFVTLNPCHVSVDDIIVWEHITSPLPRLSLLKTAPPYVYWATHIYTHMQTYTERETHWSVYKCDINISTHTNNSEHTHYVWAGELIWCKW